MSEEQPEKKGFDTPLGRAWSRYRRAEGPPENVNRAFRAQVRRGGRPLPHLEIFEGFDPGVMAVMQPILNESDRVGVLIVTGVLPLFGRGLRHKRKISIGSMAHRIRRATPPYRQQGVDRRANALFKSRDLFEFVTSLRRFMGLAPDENLLAVDMEALYFDLRHLHAGDQIPQAKWLMDYYRSTKPHT